MAGTAPVPLAAIAQDYLHSQRLFNLQRKPVFPTGSCPGLHLLSLTWAILSLSDWVLSGNNVEAASDYDVALYLTK